VSAYRRAESIFPDVHLRDPDNWPDVDFESLRSEARELFLRRKRAVTEFLRGLPLDEIRATTNLSRSEIYRLIHRCAQTHPDGMIYGFRALIPNSRTRTYTRRKTITAVGAKGGGLLSALFEAYPSVEEAVQKAYSGGRGRGRRLERNLSLKEIHRVFLEACAEAGVAPDHYPFSQVKRGLEALRVYLRRLADLDPRRAADRDGGPDAARRWAHTGVAPTPPRVQRPYARVEMDGHKLDIRCVVDVPGIDGVPVRVPLERFWILVLIESASRAVLAYHICLAREYGEEDVLHTFRKSLQTWRPHQPTLPELHYKAGAGFPSGTIPQYRGAQFDMIKLDNAMAHRAHRVRDRLIDIFGCTINYGPAGTPEARAIVERFFQNITTSMHRLPSTTGNRPGDPRGVNAARNAVKFNVQLDHLEQVLEVLIANYNAMTHSETGRAPLEHLRYFASLDSHLIRRLPDDMGEVAPMFQHRVLRRVRGNIQQGKRPYIEYEGVHYQNETLAGLPSLIGKQLSLRINTEDLRFINAYLPDGAALGTLRANGLWSVTPHSVRTRRAINAARRAKQLHFGSAQNPVDCWLEFLASQASSKPKAANDLTRAQRQITSSPEEEVSVGTSDATSISGGSDWTARRKNWISIT